MKQSQRMILKNALILSLNANDDVFHETDILIEGDTIKDIRKNIETYQQDQVIDCTNKLVTPGFVNSHLHSDEHMQKGMFDNLPLELWMLYAYAPIGFGPFSEKLIYLRTMIGAIENIRSGVTCMQDDVSELPFPTMEGHATMIKAYKDIGMRLNLSIQELQVGILDNIPYLNELLPQNLKETFGKPRASEFICKQAEEAIQEWNGKDDVRIVVSISGPQRCDEKHAKEMFKIAEKYDTPYHIHVNESRIQQISGRLFYNSTIPQYSERIGILSPRTTIAHSIWVTDEDIDVYSRTGINIAHNILSNLKLGSGIMPLIKLREAGVNICLGCDGTCSNDSQNFLEVIKSAALIHKVTQPDFRKWPSADEILRMATINGARSTMRSNEIGSLEVGKKADMVVFDLETVAFTPLSNIKNQIVYCENGQSIEKVIIRGRLVMDNHTILTIDEKKIIKEAQEIMVEMRQKQEAIKKYSDPLFPYMENIYWKCINDSDPLWRLTASKDEYPPYDNNDNNNYTDKRR